jgi:17beta-estradiol 17-dehydrogenase / very-long-chain 3-oxoacyl-CoA reductase
MIKKRRGLILNVSSISGRRPTPLLALYSGTKGFIDLFSRFVKIWFHTSGSFFILFRSLAAECASRGVYVQSLCPGYVVSKLSGIRKASLIAPTPEKFVLSALDRVTLPFTTGYWTHELQVKNEINDNCEWISCFWFLGFYSITFTRISFE